MFQGKNWLKGALDSLAEEQARFHRPAQPSQSPSASGQTRRTTSSQLRSPGSQLQRQKSDDAKEKLAALSTPDPDPAGFDPDKIAQDADAPATAPIAADEPKPSAASEQPPGQSEVATTGVENGSTVIEPEEKPKDAGTGPAGELPSDVQTKLRKLNKLESKYQELLKAYRKAHARNSFIEPFEARLRESTPLTSIADPDALVDYLNQLNTKGGLVMGELKKVSAERDSLKQKLDEAEQKTKDALDEVAQLKSTQEEPATPPPPEPEDEAAGVAANESPVNASSSSPSFAKRLFSPKQKPTASAAPESEEMFSIDNEVPRLEGELEQKSNRVDQLEADNRVLKDDLASARESAEQMMLDLEKTKEELESAQAAHTKTSEERSLRIQALEENIRNLETKLKETETEVASCKAEIQAKESKIRALEVDIQAAAATRGGEVDTTEDTAQVETPQAETPQADEETASSKKKKSKKKKKKAGAATTEPAESQGAIAPSTTRELVSADTVPQSKIDEYLDQIKQKDAALEKLSAKMKSQEDLTEEIEGLRDELINVGQEHVEAKDKLSQLQAEKEELQKRVHELEEELGGATGGSESKDEVSKDTHGSLDSLEAERNTLTEKVKSLETELEDQKRQASATSATSSKANSELSAEFEDLKAKSKSLESDLSAAQQLAASRYKEMTSLRDLLQKAQPELVSLRTEVSELKTSRDELAARNRELRKLELREESLRVEFESVKRDLASKEADMKLLNQRLSAETSQRINLEEGNRRAQRDLLRAQTEKNDAVTTRDTTAKELGETKSQLDEARTRLQQLERQVEQLNRDTENLKDEISLKTAQHASAESLMTSVRDQAAEMATQMKEAKERCESLEDELTDAHRLMSERGREGETMRRLLSEVEGRAEARVKEMREKMDMAVQERDRAEDEASSIGRRRAREMDDLKGKLRDLERELRHAGEDKTDLERIEKDLRRQKEDDNRRIEQSAVEIADVRKAMGELRDALDDGERQVREYEVERTELKRSMEEVQQRCEKLQKSNKTMTDELRSLRATRIRPVDSPSPSSRSSFDSTRRVTSPTQNHSTNANNLGGAVFQSPSQPSLARTPSTVSGGGSGSSAAPPALDYVYLKNVLLQFLEQKDKGHQMQLVPVLSMLLRFDKKDEQKWMAAIGAK